MFVFFCICHLGLEGVNASFRDCVCSRVTHRPQQPQEPVLTRFASAAGGSRRQVPGPEGGRRAASRTPCRWGRRGPAAPRGLMPGMPRTWPPRASASTAQAPSHRRWGRAHREVTWRSWLPGGGRVLCSRRWSDGGGRAELPTQGQVGQVRWARRGWGWGWG